MAEFPALPLWTDAFVGDTTHLSCELVGAYLLLLFAAWRRPNCDLPDDDKFLAQMTRCDIRTWRARYRPILAPFHTIENGTWTQKRLHKERNRVRLRGQIMRDNANRRWSKNKDIADADAHASADANAYATISISKKEDKKPVVAAAAEKAAAPKTGTRWRTDAAVPIDWILMAGASRASHRLPEIDLGLEAEKFSNYWTGKSGKDATKLDWRKTWINWALGAKGQANGHGKQTSNNDRFLAGAADAIREALGPTADGGDNVIVGPFGRPLLPP